MLHIAKKKNTQIMNKQKPTKKMICFVEIQNIQVEENCIVHRGFNLVFNG